jgi:hypothetical protein
MTDAPKRSQGVTERAAGADLRALAAQDAVLPDATAVAALYRRLARGVDAAAAEDDGYRVAFIGHRLVECHAYLTGRRPDAPADVDPFGLSAAVVDPSFT